MSSLSISTTHLSKNNQNKAPSCLKWFSFFFQTGFLFFSFCAMEIEIHLKKTKSVSRLDWSQRVL